MTSDATGITSGGANRSEAESSRDETGEFATVLGVANGTGGICLKYYC